VGGLLAAFRRSAKADQGATGRCRTRGIGPGIVGDPRSHNYRFLFAIRKEIVIKPGITAGLDE